MWKARLRSLDFILCAEESHEKVELYNNCPHCSWRMALSRAGREAKKQNLAAIAVVQEGDDIGSDYSGGQRIGRGGKMLDIICIRYK